MKFLLFRKAVLAGIAIAMGGYVYLTVGGLPGAVLFAFGLLTVVHYGLALFTGKAGYFDSKKTLVQLFALILTGNLVGCFLMACVSWPAVSASTAVSDAAAAIVEARLNAGILANLVLAVPCGFIMTTAVEFGRKGQYLPLLFGVPLFIMCGFRHSIADAFYYLAAADISKPLIGTWLLIVIGNFLGCNLYRLILPEKE